MGMGLRDFDFRPKMLLHKLGRREVVGELKRAGQRLWTGWDDTWKWSMDMKTEETWLEVLRWMQNCRDEWKGLPVYDKAIEVLGKAFDWVEKREVFDKKWLEDAERGVKDAFSFIGSAEAKIHGLKDGRMGSPELTPEEEALFECSRDEDWKDLDCHDRWSRILHELVELLEWENKSQNALEHYDDDINVLQFEDLGNGLHRLKKHEEYMTEDQLKRYNEWAEKFHEIETVGREKKDRAIGLIAKLWTRFWD